MKKLLSILAAVGLATTTGISVVACAPNNNKTDDSENEAEIKVQVAKSTIRVGETLEIKIENYNQIKETLGTFTLKVYSQTSNSSADQQPRLKKIGGFDQKEGKFTVEGTVQGIAEMMIQAYRKDKNLSQEPIMSTLIINVLAVEAQQLEISSDKTELPPSLNSHEEAIIQITDYENIKNKFDDFALVVTTLETVDKNLDVVASYNSFKKEKGEFHVWGSFPGKAKISVFGTPTNKKNQNLKNQSNTLATNEVIITVGKIDLELLTPQLEKGDGIGYGLTGSEFIKAFEKFHPFKYNQDYEISNFNLEEKLEKNSKIEVKAKENSKILQGNGSLTLTKLDIRQLKEKVKAFEIGWSNQEFQKVLEAGMESVSKEAIFGQDYKIFDYRPLIVGGEMTVTTDSELLTGRFDIPIIGESYREWDLNKLNEQANLFVDAMNKLIKENEGSGHEPIENPKLKDKWAKNYFEMYSFFARVFLETDYVVTGLSELKPEIKKVDENTDYPKAKDELEEKLNDRDQVGKKDEYVSALMNYDDALSAWI